METVDLLVRTADPARLDKTVQQLGAAAVIQDSPEEYASFGIDIYAVRCFGGCVGYIEFAIGNQGYGEVIERREV